MTHSRKESPGFSARSAYDANSALSLAVTFVPDVVMADIAMPGSNGLDLAARLRELDPGLHALVAITGYADDEHRQAASEAGFDFYFVKPPDIYSSGMPNPRFAGASFLMQTNALLTEEVAAWEREIQAAHRARGA